MALREEGYWDNHYELELRNFEQDGDEGEVWFGNALNRRIADWLVAKLSPKIGEAEISTKVIDVGCGNAYMLITLLEKLKTIFGDELAKTLLALGVDYSIKSINLSQMIIKKRDLEDLIRLEQCDFVNLSQVNSISNTKKFDAIIDKGTFDAICLLAGHLEETKQKYMESLYSLVKQGTVFILASCNHTQEELLQLFTLECPGKCDVKLIDEIETPKIQFGGKEGSQVTCLIFEFV